MEKEVFDVAIVGSGPAGLTAAIFARRANLSVVCFERLVAGGQVALTTQIGNYPGFESISGADLGQKFYNHAKNVGMVSRAEEVLAMELEGDIKIIKTNKAEYYARSVILCMGAYARKLDLEGEKHFAQGRGISYCATCDGALFKGRECAVVGGANSAIEDALYLSKLAKTVYIIYRQGAFRADEVTLKELGAVLKENGGNVVPVFNSLPNRLIGKDFLSAIEVKNVQTGEVTLLKVDGLFVAIGRKPDTDLVAAQIEVDAGGYIVVDREMRTRVAGVFAAGDVTNSHLKLIATAVGDGAIAADQARSFVVKSKIKR